MVKTSGTAQKQGAPRRGAMATRTAQAASADQDDRTKFQTTSNHLREESTRDREVGRSQGREDSEERAHSAFEEEDDEEGEEEDADLIEFMRYCAIDET